MDVAKKDCLLGYYEVGSRGDMECTRYECAISWSNGCPTNLAKRAMTEADLKRTVGEVRRFVFTSKKGKHKGKRTIDDYIFLACIDCGRGRWVRYEQGKPDSARCRSCSMKINNIYRLGRSTPNWKGGKLRSQGYILVLIKGHPRADVRGYVREHLLVLEQKLGRPLLLNEVVHHLNGIKDDNRPENLVAIMRGSHVHLAEPFKERIRELEVEIARLQSLINRGTTQKAS